MRTRLTAATLFLFLASTVLSAVDGDKAAYIGGTLTGVKQKADGALITTADALVFTAKKSEAVTIPYTAIESLEYGQKAGRRVGVAIAVSPIALFSQRRNHYLTVTYKDAAGIDQAAIFELGKEIVRITLTVLETRSKKTIEYQDDEARKAMGGGK